MSFWRYETVCSVCGEKCADQGGMVGDKIMGPLVDKCPECGAAMQQPPDPRDAEIKEM